MYLIIRFLAKQRVKFEIGFRNDNYSSTSIYYYSCWCTVIFIYNYSTLFHWYYDLKNRKKRKLNRFVIHSKTIHIIRYV